MELLFVGLACAASLAVGWFGGRNYERCDNEAAKDRAVTIDLLIEHGEQQQSELERLRETVGKLIDLQHREGSIPRPLGMERTSYEQGR